jgi:1-acyl-sn-glycerol-3-phosphate acyltransferase
VAADEKNVERALARQHAIHRTVAWLAGPFWIPLAALVLRFGMGYRIDDVARVRREFRELRERTPAPMMICANHLTLIDSFLVGWAFAGPFRHLLRFRDLPWNVPEAANFAFTWWARGLAYLGKCIPIVRGGPRVEVAFVLARIAHLTRVGELALIFPEGGRSRSGRVEVDAAAWGVGRIIGAVPDCRVLCVYLRGYDQETWSATPKRGERFRVELACIEPKSDHKGVRRSRDLAQQVVTQLAHMEDSHFANAVRVGSE